MSIDWSKQVTAADKQAAKDQQDRNDRKQERDRRVAEIVVTTASGLDFNGDEPSQNRIMRAIEGYTEPVDWIMADNTTATVELSELQEALALAVEAQQAIWII